ncbi:Na-translocating system protein MpsC family protein [Bacillus sp. FJAT-44742]|uniref:Na-translocating system protein MpsC family protein n=1 Tax=Bacillus sp. FJAT-44742 TaxID=2014005 RepID=UPI000C2486B9|nr:Na-translocating system protein MpsC family protein [Bacillus sp. FJAT-44742]
MNHLGDFKQELIKDYNDINRQLFDIGVKHQKVEIIGDKVIILANHKRIPSLKCLDESNRLVTRLTDISIIENFKVQLKKTIEEKYNMKINAILKDYDPATEYSGTIIILEREVSYYLTEQFMKV